MVGSDHDLDWSTSTFTANAAERSAFANGHASRDAEVARLESEVLQLRTVLINVHAVLNSSSRYKTREARLVLAPVIDGS